MRKLEVALAEKRYDIWIGENILAEALREIAGLARRENVAVVSDETVWGLYGEAFSAAMADVGLPFRPILMRPGERSKSLDGLSAVYAGFAEAKLRRGGLVIALGGGVIGDLAGFAAATWQRGTRYAQLPTTLLAQVDSSVGGKTAIDLPSGKNMAGAFRHPEFVAVDTAFLRTLPPREYACGMGEIIKYGAIRSAALFEKLAGENIQLEEVIEECLRIKADIVGRDALDNGERKLLNFGHTFGHAAESLGGYEAFNHGEAVAVGMVLAAKFGEAVGFTPPGSADRIAALAREYGLPVSCPYSPGALLEWMARDKKSAADGIDLVLLRDIGDAAIRRSGLEEIRAFLEEEQGDGGV